MSFIITCLYVLIKTESYYILFATELGKMPFTHNFIFDFGLTERPKFHFLGKKRWDSIHTGIETYIRMAIVNSQGNDSQTLLDIIQSQTRAARTT